MDDQGTQRPRIDVLEEKIERLAAQNEKLLAMLTGSRSDAEPGEGGAAPQSDGLVAVDGGGVVAMDRRNALRRLGTAAAATVGLVAANGAVNPARAADGDNVVVGGNYTGTETYFFNGTQGSSFGALGAESGGAANALWAFTNGTGAAVRAQSGSATGHAVHGSKTVDGGTGVLGEATGDSSTLGYGVRGVTGNTTVERGAAVAGFADSGGIGVWGRSSDGYGVKAHADGDGGIGVYAEGGDSISVPGTGVYAVSTFGAPLHLSSQSIAVPPTSGTWSAGQFLVKSGHVWYCIASGTGTGSEWVRLSSTFIPLPAPVRVYDSRAGEEPLAVTKGKLVKNTPRDLDATVTGDIPASASAVLVNATVANTTSSGFLTLYPDGESNPGTATVNYTTGAIVGNNATVGLTAGKLTAEIGGGSASNKTDLILDAYGYYA